MPKSLSQSVLAAFALAAFACTSLGAQEPSPPPPPQRQLNLPPLQKTKSATEPKVWVTKYHRAHRRGQCGVHGHHRHAGHP